MKFILDWLQPRGFAVIDLATGFGDEAKWLAKTVGVSDGIVDGAKAADALDDAVDLSKITLNIGKAENVTTSTADLSKLSTMERGKTQKKLKEIQKQAK